MGERILGSFEQAAEFGMFMQMMDSEKNDALTSAGLNPDDLEDMGHQGAVLRRDLRHGGDMGLGNHQNMGRSLGRNIPES